MHRSGSAIVALKIPWEFARVRADLCAGEADQQGEEEDGRESWHGPALSRGLAEERGAHSTRDLMHFSVSSW